MSEACEEPGPYEVNQGETWLTVGDARAQARQDSDRDQLRIIDLVTKDVECARYGDVKRHSNKKPGRSRSDEGSCVRRRSKDHLGEPLRSNSSNSNEFARQHDGKGGSPTRERHHRSINSDSSLLLTNLTTNDQQLALLESAKDKLRMATIERKRMSSINYERGRGYFNRVMKEKQN